MASSSPLLVCVVGPTAIGKTSLAISIAKAFQTEIISADSRQFFKEMSIGTAVPSPAELREVPHHFIQNKSIFESYSVGDFEKEAMALLETLFDKHSVVVLVGGSGLYVNAVVQGLDNFPDVAPGVRNALNEQWEVHGIESLREELQKADPDYYEKVDIHNPHRLIRALEVFRSTGRPFSSYLEGKSSIRGFRTLFVGLTAERELVYDRINKRVDLMMEAGLLDEVRSLHPHKKLNALQTVGYRELFEHLDGERKLTESVEEIKKNTRRFAKRQGTWFRKRQDIYWFDYSLPHTEIINFIKKKNTL